MPILYYSANSLVAAKSNASITTFKYDPADPNAATPGIYTYSDNSLFTGLCSGGPNGSCTVPRWDFGNGPHKLEYGPNETWTDPVNPPTLPDAIKTQPYSFAYYIMNKDAYESSGQKAVVPSRKDSYILISPGKDGLFGTGDDVTNFQ